MTLRKLKIPRCKDCDTDLLTKESKLREKCYFCSHYNEIKKRRLEEWNHFWEIAIDLEDEFVKRYVVMNLLKCKINYIKNGVMK